MTKPDLPTVTLCAATSVNVEATLEALRLSELQANFARCLLFTDAQLRDTPAAIEVVPIAPLGSAQGYSNFILDGLVAHVTTDHCLLIQWDGFVIDGGRWTEEWLDFDYIGAPWPQFPAGGDVGNGGFSLRSRRLLEACRDPDFVRAHPEDVAICRTNRALLEQRHGIRFADRESAALFSFERTIPPEPTFGFHGIFNMAAVLGIEKFWQLYAGLDEPSTAFVDYWSIFRQLGAGKSAARRRLRLTMDRFRSFLSR